MNKLKISLTKKQKAFIDDVRARNGNLTVTLTQRAQEE